MIGRKTHERNSTFCASVVRCDERSYVFLEALQYYIVHRIMVKSQTVYPDRCPVRDYLVINNYVISSTRLWVPREIPPLFIP